MSKETLSYNQGSALKAKGRTSEIARKGKMQQLWDRFKTKIMVGAIGLAVLSTPLSFTGCESQKSQISKLEPLQSKPPISKPPVEEKTSTDEKQYAYFEDMLDSAISPGSTVRLHVVLVLSGALQDGYKPDVITTFLNQQLRNPDSTIREYAADGLTSFYIMKMQWNEIATLLKDKDKNIRIGATDALVRAQEQGEDIKSTLPVLLKMFNDPSFACYNAIQIFGTEAWKGEDISHVVPDLETKLKDKRYYIRSVAAEALVFHYMNKEKKNELERLLKHKNRDVREGAVNAIDTLVQRGDDISIITPLIETMLSDKDWFVRRDVAKVLALLRNRKD